MATAVSLPDVRSLGDCVDFSTTVAPFIPQLAALPQRLLAAGASLPDLCDVYLSTNPVVTAAAASLLLSAVVLVVSEANRNYSQVDRLWSLLPTAYLAHFCAFAHLAGIRAQRLDCLLACGVWWSARLTFNYWRKGGYSIGSEDYRWEILKKYVKPYDYGVFFIFNVIFISFIQNVLLLSVALPAYVLVLSSTFEPHLVVSDLVATTTLIGLVTLEWFADQQQWDFQSAKKEYLQTARPQYGFKPIDLDRGFVVTGLWTYSRHPNFAAEQTVWLTVYAWSCAVSGTYANWTGCGALAYLLLFQGSTWLTERITAGKYHEYPEYQRRVGRFLPKLFPPAPGDFRDKWENTRASKKGARGFRK